MLPDAQPGVDVVSASMRTDIGKIRERNDDAAHVDIELGLFIVADGMGGRGGGDVASGLSIGVVRETVADAREDLAAIAHATDEHSEAAVRRLLERAVRGAHKTILDYSSRDPDLYGMGTTLDVVLILNDIAFVAHVGDGRTYIMRDGVARQATNDHTVAEVLRRAGTLTPEEALKSPLRSVLCNSVGGAPDLSVEHRRIQLQPDDRLFLCTDGLYEYFDDDELARIVTSAEGDSALATLIDGAYEGGGHDNITGLVVQIGATAAPVDDVDDAPPPPTSSR